MHARNSGHATQPDTGSCIYSAPEIMDSIDQMKQKWIFLLCQLKNTQVLILHIVVSQVFHNEATCGCKEGGFSVCMYELWY